MHLTTKSLRWPFLLVPTVRGYESPHHRQVIRDKIFTNGPLVSLGNGHLVWQDTRVAPATRYAVE